MESTLSVTFCGTAPFKVVTPFSNDDTEPGMVALVVDVVASPRMAVVASWIPGISTNPGKFPLNVLMNTKAPIKKTRKPKAINDYLL
jgi:hypothetical protein